MRAVPAHGDKQHAFICAGVIWGSGGRAGAGAGACACACALVRRRQRRRNRRKIRTAYNAELDARIDQQRKTNGVLTTAQEPLGPIDRIKCPHACVTLQNKRRRLKGGINHHGRKERKKKNGRRDATHVLNAVHRHGSLYQ